MRVFELVDYSRVGSKFSQDFEADIFDDEQPSVENIKSGLAKSPPALEGGYGEYGIFQLVGHGHVTNERCGTFRQVVGCSNEHLHRKTAFDKSGRLVNYSGKGYFKPVFHSCDKPSCPVCYERGWAVRQAGNIEFRLEQASKKFGLAEHIIVALPPKYWSLDYKGLRRLCARVLSSRGIIGGCLIFHGFRYNVRQQWYWSPHFHVIGFILGGYRCRGCPKCVKGCGGFVDRNYRLNEVDGCYVKVKGKRKSIFGTAWYQLHHSSVRMDVKRFHVSTWFGVCSYRKLKISKELRKEYNEKHKCRCPICNGDLVRHDYHGRDARIIALFRKRRGAREYVEGFFDAVSDWSEVVESCSVNYGGGD